MTEAQGRFLQGLIQVAACALKVAAGNRRGARRRLQRGCRHLEAVMDEAAGRSFMGLDLTAFREAVDSYYRPRLEGGGAVTHDPERYPYIVLKNAGGAMSTRLAWRR